MKTFIYNTKWFATFAILMLLPFCELMGKNYPVALFSRTSQSITFDDMSEESIEYYKKNNDNAKWSDMFSSSSNLKTIFCNDTWPASIKSDYLFYGCDSLAGAISYNKNKITAEYANPTTGRMLM